MMIWLKSLHVIAICVWASGLLCLPGLYRQRAFAGTPDTLRRLHLVARFIYVAVISPAAFIAIATGAALIFVRHTFEPWLLLKLMAVGAMVIVHVVTGLVIVRHFEEGGAYPAWRFVTVSILTLAIITVILFAVLAKPDLTARIPHDLFEPGALGRRFGGVVNDLNPFQR